MFRAPTYLRATQSPRLSRIILTAMALACTSSLGLTAAQEAQPAGSAKAFQVTAERFKFFPASIEVKQGDHVRITLKSADRTHGFAIRKLRLNQVIPKSGEPVTIEFVASEAGTFQISCSEYCGRGHRAMKGTLVVTPRETR